MSEVLQSVDEIITEIVMSRDGVPWLIVEGVTDEKLLRGRLFRVQPKIVVASGWFGVKRIVEIALAERTTVKVAGLIDRDYRDYTGAQITHPRIILTDLRDVENMMFWSSAISRVYSEWGASSKLPRRAAGDIDVDDIRLKICGIAEVIGRFRIYCCMNNIDICLSGIDHLKFVCDRALALNVSDFLAHVNGKNPGKRNVSVSEWNAAQALSWGDNKDAHQYLCHGHDVMAIVGISLRKKWGSNNFDTSRSGVESCFRVGYPDSELEASPMWHSLGTLIV